MKTFRNPCFIQTAQFELNVRLGSGDWFATGPRAPLSSNFKTEGTSSEVLGLISCSNGQDIFIIFQQPHRADEGE